MVKQKLFRNYKLEQTNVQLRSFSGCIMKPIGCLKIYTTYNTVISEHFNFYVVNGNLTKLIKLSLKLMTIYKKSLIRFRML